MAAHVWMSGTMLMAGLGIPVMAAMSGALGKHIGTPGAALVLFSGALCCALAATALSGGFSVGALKAAPNYTFMSGIFVAFYVLTITMIGPRIGIGNAVFLVLLGQMLSSALIDYFGAFSAAPVALSPPRLLGLALMTAGVMLAQRPE